MLTTLPDRSDLTALTATDPDVHRQLRWYWRDHAFPPIGLRDCARLERSNAAVLREQLRSFAPDVVMWWAMGGMSLSLLEQVRRAAIPAVGVVGDDWLVYGPRVDAWIRRWRGARRVAAPLAERLAGIPSRIDFDRGIRWAFNSRYTLATARAAGFRLRQATVAHPGVDRRLFAPRPAQEWAWRLLYCGRLDPRKGVETAIETLAQLPDAATLTVHGAGDAAYASQLGALAARLGMQQRVRFSSGEHRQVADVYAAADAVIFPVRWQEPWGLVPLEAMSIGRPVIATRAGGGAAEYLRDRENCLQFEPGDAAGAAGALRRLAADPASRASLIRSGHRTAGAFTLTAFHDALERELHAAIGR